ncbi:hypothetical protein HH310_28625 [Actinoplanes sp. TBRC 11911]|uniref:DUF6879 family protein n=1 Tax=Actinoplanes sp. TBRC 11911 TaxID=2729386 RepID=UPI00145F3429|nr:DUF6879 family protein [Actinoplanes sp. TBRC 11911]NMO55138.1 hypothetical protein [Actinoplanes sp. TBRC 11911]
MSLVDAAKTTYLPLDDYIEDFTTVSANLVGDIWKSERAQHFQEPGNRSWEAYIAGRWEEALQASTSELTELKQYFSQLERRGTQFYRIRVVELPLSSYLRWELHILRVRLLAGERIRIAPPPITDRAEQQYGMIPELVLLGDTAGYIVDYSDDGVAKGAAKFDDPLLIGRCRAALAEMYEHSEEFEQFFAREVLPVDQR